MKHDAKTLTKKDILGTDYLNNMFQDGDNRTANNDTVNNAPDYDNAARTADPTLGPTNTIPPIAYAENTYHSRDGTDAAGLYDESGGPIGGTEEELDSL